MSTTTPEEWPGVPLLTSRKINTILGWYLDMLAVEDHAGDDTHEWYWGYRAACSDILSLLHSTEIIDDSAAS